MADWTEGFWMGRCPMHIVHTPHLLLFCSANFICKRNIVEKVLVWLMITKQRKLQKGVFLLLLRNCLVNFFSNVNQKKSYESQKLNSRFSKLELFPLFSLFLRFAGFRPFQPMASTSFSCWHTTPPGEQEITVKVNGLRGPSCPLLRVQPGVE